MPNLIPTTWVGTMVDTMVWDTMEDTTPTMEVSSMERGLLMPNLLLMPRLIPTTWVGTMVDTMVWDTMEDTIPTMEVLSMERGPLMLSLLLIPRLIPTTWVDTMVCVTMDTIPDTMGMVITSERGLLMLSL